jgi:hypothetical protein
MLIVIVMSSVMLRVRLRGLESGLGGLGIIRSL